MRKAKFIVAANWKMNKSPVEASAFLGDFFGQFAECPSDREVLFFAPAVDLVTVAEKLGKRLRFGFGPQNIYFANSGAYTGETSPQVVREMGATHALIGHSERRQLFQETNLDVARKVKAAQSVGLVPMLCLGETLEERESGKTEHVISTQLRAGLEEAGKGKPFLIAYEPVWAIGTGRNATPAQAGEAHACLRGILADMIGAEAAAGTSILYGGSVKPDNAQELALQADVDGFLVGGASLQVAGFLDLVRVRLG